MLDGYQILGQLTESERRHFHETVYSWKSTDGLARRLLEVLRAVGRIAGTAC